jgi:DNA-binding SARP family transcriptional activator
MTILELRFLGGLAVHQDDAPLTALKSQKGKALLCYLVVTGKDYTRSALAGLLWPEMPEANALMNLRKVLDRLKPHVAPYLLITRESIAFNQDASYWLDVTEFEAGMATRSDIGRLQTAVALYRGDFLDGFDLPDAPRFDGWVLRQRARLRDAALDILHHLIMHFATQDTYELAITYARQLLAIEPWHRHF